MSVSPIRGMEQEVIQRMLDGMQNPDVYIPRRVEIIQKPNRKLNYQKGVSKGIIGEKYGLSEFPILDIGIHLDLYC